VDIRQWVLVSHLNPLKIWFFSAAYVRICATSYNLGDLEDRLGCTAWERRVFMRP